MKTWLSTPRLRPLGHVTGITHRQRIPSEARPGPRLHPGRTGHPARRVSSAPRQAPAAGARGRGPCPPEERRTQAPLALVRGRAAPPASPRVSFSLSPGNPPQGGRSSLSPKKEGNERHWPALSSRQPSVRENAALPATLQRRKPMRGNVGGNKKE